MPEPPSSPVVACRGLEHVHGSGPGAVQALRGIDLDVHHGELLALVGPSGSGKSTLLHLLGAMERPTAGSIEAAGLDLGALSDSAAARYRREHVGFVFQFFNLIPTLTAWDNVTLPARLARRDPRASRERARALLDRVGLGDRLTARPDELSGGQQQRVAVARALCCSPELILADEPTGNLDRRTGGEVLDLLQELVHDQGIALVMATHAEDAVARASRTVHLVDGRLA